MVDSGGLTLALKSRVPSYLLALLLLLFFCCEEFQKNER